MAGPEWTVVLEADPDPSLRAKILEPLSAHNDAAAGPGGWATLAVTVRDAAGAVVGGLWGRTGYGFVFVELLALGPARGGGLGREVMALAEAEARRRGLVGMWLDTWTFQAPGFYQKLGFTECGRITEYPPGHDRIFLCKAVQVSLALLAVFKRRRAAVWMLRDDDAYPAGNNRRVERYVEGIA